MALVQVATSDAGAKNQNGLNVLYTVGDQSVAGITKYYFDGTTWQPANSQVALNATDVNNPTGLIAQIDPSNNAWSICSFPEPTASIRISTKAAIR